MSSNPAFAVLAAARGGFKVLNPNGEPVGGPSAALDGETQSEDTPPRKMSQRGTPETPKAPKKASKKSPKVPPVPPKAPPTPPESPVHTPTDPPDNPLNNPQLAKVARLSPTIAAALYAVRSQMMLLTGETGDLVLTFLGEEDVATDGVVYELVLRVRKAT